MYKSTNILTEFLSYYKKVRKLRTFLLVKNVPLPTLVPQNYD